MRGRRQRAGKRLVYLACVAGSPAGSFSLPGGSSIIPATRHAREGGAPFLPNDGNQTVCGGSLGGPGCNEILRGHHVLAKAEPELQRHWWGCLEARALRWQMLQFTHGSRSPFSAPLGAVAAFHR